MRCSVLEKQFPAHGLRSEEVRRQSSVPCFSPAPSRREDRAAPEPPGRGPGRGEAPDRVERRDAARAHPGRAGPARARLAGRVVAPLGGLCDLDTLGDVSYNASVF